MPSSLPRLRSCLRVSAAFCLSVLGGCGSGFTPLERSLPATPSFAKPVAYQPGRWTEAGKPGESCYVALDRNEGTTRLANSTIVKFRRWYEDRRKDYSGAKS